MGLDLVASKRAWSDFVDWTRGHVGDHDEGLRKLTRALAEGLAVRPLRTVVEATVVERCGAVEEKIARHVDEAMDVRWRDADLERRLAAHTEALVSGALEARVRESLTDHVDQRVTAARQAWRDEEGAALRAEAVAAATAADDRVGRLEVTVSQTVRHLRSEFEEACATSLPSRWTKELSERTTLVQEDVARQLSEQREQERERQRAEW